MDNNFSFNTPMQESPALSINSVMRRVYLKMTLGLIVSALVALFTASTPELLSLIFSGRASFLVLILAEIGLVIGITSGLNKLSSPMAALLFYVFAVVNGFVLTPVLLVYTSVSIAKTFFITAGVFGAMTVYGYCTSRDLTGWGSFLIMALFGLIIVAVVNMFLGSSGLDLIISCAGVLIFIGLTAWDTQKISRMAAIASADQAGKIATIGALSLYLDFINLFLYLLRFFGRRE